MKGDEFGQTSETFLKRPGERVPFEPSSGASPSLCCFCLPETLRRDVQGFAVRLPKKDCRVPGVARGFLLGLTLADPTVIFSECMSSLA
jgi:hypothetical protein